MPNKNTSIQHCANIMELLPDIRAVFFLSFFPFFNFGCYFFCSIIFCVRRFYSFDFFLCCFFNFSFIFQLNVTTKSTLKLSLTPRIVKSNANNNRQQHRLYIVRLTITRGRNIEKNVPKSKHFWDTYILMHESLSERKRLKNVSPACTYILVVCVRVRVCDQYVRAFR